MGVRQRCASADAQFRVKAEPRRGRRIRYSTPHWFGAAGEESVEILSLLGKQGERIHVRAAARRKAQSA
jgi:hypothetical protein